MMWAHFALIIIFLWVVGYLLISLFFRRFAMCERFSDFLKKEDGNSLVENVIILPLIFLCIYFLILGSFIIHDKIVLDSAVERGAVYAAKCVADPNYAALSATAGTNEKSNEMGLSDVDGILFSNVGDNIHPYRYIKLTYADEIERYVAEETLEIVNKTKIPWREIKNDQVECSIKNYVVYQEVTVSAKATYPLPKLFGIIGLPTEFSYETSAREAVTDPDELIRNADLVVDIITYIDNKTGNHLSKLTNTLDKFKAKIKNSTFAKFLSME